MVEDINELAIIYKRVPTEKDKTVGFVPVKVIEGFYYHGEDVFVDTEQNVYCHIVSLSEIGNGYANRRNIYELLKEYPDKTLEQIKEILLKDAQKYTYTKNLNKEDDSFCMITMYDKENDIESILEDVDTPFFFEAITMIDEEVAKKTSPKKTTNKSSEKEEDIQDFATPNDLINEIKKAIKGQDEVVEKIVSSIWMKYRYPTIPKANILVIGPAGCGKTAIFNKLRKVLDIPISMYGLAGVSQTGYQGSSVDELLLNHYISSGNDLEYAENGIIFIDEFDKIGTNQNIGELGSIAVQNELLKIIEGTEKIIPVSEQESIVMDTTNILFICCGAFSKIYEAANYRPIGFDTGSNKKETKKITTEQIIKDGGIIPELARRLPVITKLEDISKKRDVLKDILLNAEDSVLMTRIEAIENEGIELDKQDFDSLIELIIDKATKINIGASGLIGPVEDLFSKIFLDVENNPNKYNKLVITPNQSDGSIDYQLIPKKVKTRTKKKIDKHPM